MGLINVIIIIIISTRQSDNLPLSLSFASFYLFLGSYFMFLTVNSAVVVNGPSIRSQHDAWANELPTVGIPKSSNKEDATDSVSLSSEPISPIIPPNTACQAISDKRLVLSYGVHCI